jgi:hypothetical protein
MTMMQTFFAKYRNKWIVFFLVLLFVLFYYRQNNLSLSQQPYIRMFIKILPNRNLFASKFELKNYTTLTNSSKFIQIHEDIIKNRTRSKVVFYEIDKGVGYGNRLYSMLTAFLVALVTESALLINWPLIENYIETPLSNAFVKFNNTGFFDFNQKNPKIYQIISSSPNIWAPKKRILKG